MDSCTCLSSFFLILMLPIWRLNQNINMITQLNVHYNFTNLLLQRASLSIQSPYDTVCTHDGRACQQSSPTRRPQVWETSIQASLHCRSSGWWDRGSWQGFLWLFPMVCKAELESRERACQKSDGCGLARHCQWGESGWNSALER